MSPLRQRGGAPAGPDVLELLRRMWLRRDPVPPHLADTSLFAVRLEGLDAHVALLVGDSLATAGARSQPLAAEEPARTLTFSGPGLTATVTISDSSAGAWRLDGWIAPAEPLGVEIRLVDRPAREVVADDDGRFVVEGLPAGLVQLVFHPVAGRRGLLTQAVAAPPVRL